MIAIIAIALTAMSDQLSRQMQVCTTPPTHVLLTGPTHDMIAARRLLQRGATMRTRFGILLQGLLCGVVVLRFGTGRKVDARYAQVTGAVKTTKGLSTTATVLVVIMIVRLHKSTTKGTFDKLLAAIGIGLGVVQLVQPQELDPRCGVTTTSSSNSTSSTTRRVRQYRLHRSDTEDSVTLSIGTRNGHPACRHEMLTVFP